MTRDEEVSRRPVPGGQETSTPRFSCPVPILSETESTLWKHRHSSNSLCILDILIYFVYIVFGTIIFNLVGTWIGSEIFLLRMMVFLFL